MIIYIIMMWLIFGIVQLFGILTYDRIHRWKDAAEIILAVAVGPLLFPIRFLLSAYARSRQRKIVRFYRNQSKIKW